MKEPLKCNYQMKQPLKCNFQLKQQEIDLPCIAEDDELHAGRRMYIYNEVLTTSILVLVYRTAS